MPDIGPWEIVIIAVVLVLLFGASKLPLFARSLGQSLRIFKSEIKGLKEDDSAAQAPAQPVAQAATQVATQPVALPTAQPVLQVPPPPPPLPPAPVESGTPGAARAKTTESR